MTPICILTNSLLKKGSTSAIVVDVFVASIEVGDSGIRLDPMSRFNFITTSYLQILEWFASFLVWFAEALESLFGPGVRNGFLGASPQRSDAFKEFDQANSSPQTADVLENTDGDGLTSPSPRPEGFGSSLQMSDMAFPCRTENIGGHPDSCPDGSFDPKGFNPYDPDEPLSIYNGDPLNFDPSSHPDPFDSNN